MKNFILATLFNIFIVCASMAEIYHGIDIDDVYKKSDWKTKNDIKDIIDDYTLLNQYKKDLKNCSSVQIDIECLNKVADKTINRFYNHNLEKSTTDYQNYVKATFNAYGIVFCLNKYTIPSGTMCHQENYGKTFDVISLYVEALLLQVEEKIKKYNFIKDYKDN